MLLEAPTNGAEAKGENILSSPEIYLGDALLYAWYPKGWTWITEPTTGRANTIFRQIRAILEVDEEPVPDLKRAWEQARYLEQVIPELAIRARQDRPMIRLGSNGSHRVHV